MEYLDNALSYELRKAEHEFGTIEHHFSFANSSYSKPYFSLSSSLILSLAILPHSIRLIKNTIFLSLASSFCILLLTFNTKFNKISWLQLNIFINNIGLLLASLVLPISRGLVTIAYGYGINAKSDIDYFAITDEILVEQAWGCDILIFRDVPDNWRLGDGATATTVPDDLSIEQSSVPNLP